MVPLSLHHSIIMQCIQFTIHKIFFLDLIQDNIKLWFRFLSLTHNVLKCIRQPFQITKEQMIMGIENQDESYFSFFHNDFSLIQELKKINATNFKSAKNFGFFPFFLLGYLFERVNCYDFKKILNILVHIIIYTHYWTLNQNV